MIIKTPSPDKDLQDFIKEYYYIHLSPSEKIKEIPIVDDCCHDMIVFKEAEAEFFYGEETKVEVINHHVFTILGVHAPYRLKFKDSLTFFTIKVHPWMNRYFFSDIEGKGIINLELYRPQLESLYQYLEKNGDIDKIVKTANNIFLNQSISMSPSIVFARSVCEFIYDKKGILKVNEISLNFKRSRQYINKVFRQEVMCSLKTFIVAVRIVALVKHKAKHKSISLTRLSYDFGYFDQAHFINDFKKVCGLTPSQYFGDLPEFMLRHQ